MNSSAKTTAISFLATAALGAAVFMGCSVSSGTVDDVDGGDQNTNEDGGTKSDTGTGTGNDAAPACEPPAQKTQFEPAAECQPCIATNCCTALVGCFGLSAEEGKLDCDGFKECVDDCATRENADECINGTAEDSCVKLAAPGVADAYNAISVCSEAKCNAECFDQADGG